MKKPLSHILLITDMDDTLLRTDKTVSRENLDALEEFRALGGKFTIATGRSIPSYLPYHQSLHPDCAVVLNNGAVLYRPDRDEILWNSILPASAKEYVTQAVQEFDSLGVEILLGKEIFIPKMNQQICDHMEHEHLVHTVAPVEQIPDEWYKVLYAMEPDELPGLCSFLEHQGHSDVTYVTSSSCYCEMLPKNTSKGDSLKILLELEQLQKHKVYAVGDYYNDIHLLEAADVAAAVDNAPDDVKAYADFVVASNNEHGIAQVVKRIMEKEL